MAKCPVCGAPMGGTTCEYCGYVDNTVQQNTNNAVPNQQIIQQVIQPQVVVTNGVVAGVSRKSKTVALLLCIFLGYFGVHKFYVGKVGMGILYLLTMGLFGIGWIVDICLIATGSFKDEFDLPLKN